MSSAKKFKSQSPKAAGTPAPKSILKTPKSSAPSATSSSKAPQTQPKVSPSSTATSETSNTSTVLKSILKKPKLTSDTPAKIPAQPAKVATLKPSSANKQTIAAPTPQKKSAKPTLKGVSSPHPSKLNQSGEAKKTKPLQKLPSAQEDDEEEDDEDDDDVNPFLLSGEDDEDDDEEDDFSVQSQIARALSTKPPSKQVKAVPQQKQAATKTKPAPQQATKASPKQTAGKPKPAVPQLSSDDEEEDDENMGEDSDEEDAIPASQAKNWKALASRTLTGNEPILKKPTGAAETDLGSGLPSVPRSSKPEQKKPANKNEGKNAAATGQKTKVEVKQAESKQKPGQKKAAAEKKPAAKAPMQMFEESDDETALDYDGVEGDEGDEGEDEQETAIMRALHKKGDFSDLITRGKAGSFEDDDEGDEGDEGDMEDDSDDPDFENEDLPIEKAAKRLEKMEKRIAEEANAELQTNMQEIQTFQLPSGQEIEKERLEAPDLTLLNQRIQDVLFTLADFRKKKEPERSRTEYMERLAQDLTTYYGYLPELIDRFLEMFSPAEAVEFLMANEAQRPVTLRINSLKTRRGDLIQSLSKRGIHVEPLADWTKVGCKVTMSKLPLGATPEYMAGHYVLQSAASFLPVMALAPQEHERVLDMCASPGGKATYIAALMKNTGMLVANDANTKRLASLTGNIHRLGVRNSVVTNFDGRKLKKHFGLFDRILLDAPCSGLGVISKDPSVKTSKTNKDIQRCSHVQKELVLAAIDMLDADSKTGGYLVYSTCSISVEENEEVVDYLLSHRNVKLVETNIPFGVVGMTRFRNKQFHPSVSMCRRFYPHVHNMDGFFVSKFKKLSDGPKVVKSSGDDASSPETETNGVAMEDEPAEEKRRKPKVAAETASAPVAMEDTPLNGTEKPKLKKKKPAATNGAKPPTPTPSPASVLASAPAPTPTTQASPGAKTGIKRKDDKAKSPVNASQPALGQSKKQKMSSTTSSPKVSAASASPKQTKGSQKKAKRKS